MKWKIFIGCDMAKDSFTFCTRNRSQVTHQGAVTNKYAAIRSWLKDLKKQYVSDQFVLGVEHTGIYTAILLRADHKTGVNICLESAIKIKRTLGLQRGKSDKVDAARIAEYLMRYTDRLQLWSPKREVLNQLNIHQKSRDRLIKARKQITRFTQESKRYLPKKNYQLAVSSTARTVNALKKDIKELDEQISSLIAQDENLSRLSKIVTSVHGVGLVTFTELALRTNEFKAYDNAKKLPCTAGVAPFEHSSGSSIRGKSRVNHNAHKRLKTLLHMCALSAIRSPGELQRFYQRKLTEGKNKMTVINAVRNKIIHRVYAVVRDNCMYQNNYQYHLYNP